MVKKPVPNRFNLIAKSVLCKICVLSLIKGSYVYAEQPSQVPLETHLSIATLHEKARLNYLHNSLLANIDYSSLHQHLKLMGLDPETSLTAMFFESSVEDEDLSYGINHCENSIPYCVDVGGDFSINHYRVSFYAERILREKDLSKKIIQDINYQESIIKALRKGPIIRPSDIDDGYNRLISTRAYLYQLMHESGSMGISGIVAAPESLSLSLFNAKRVSRMSSYFSDAFASLDSYLATNVGNAKVLEVGESDVDVSISVTTRITQGGKDRLRKAFTDAFGDGQPINMLGQGDALYYSESSSIAVFDNENERLNLCLGKLPDVSATLPSDHVKLFNLIKHSEIGMEYSVVNTVVDVPLLRSKEHSVHVRIPYEDETRTRRVKTVKVECNMSLSIETEINTLARVNVSKNELSSIKWKAVLKSNL